MIILEAPYVSDFLQKTIIKNEIPVLKTPFAEELKYTKELNLVSPDNFFSELQAKNKALLYSNSENATTWLEKYIPEHDIAIWVKMLKDKAKLREIFARRNPNMLYHTCNFNELATIDITDMPKPFVIKPRRGFASICIHAVFNNDEWPDVLNKITKERNEMQDVFPDGVVSLNEFVIERYVDGKEIAVDAYFNNEGNPVVLNILHHIMASKTDMSDRLYVTSGEIIEKYHDSMVEYLEDLGKSCRLKNFPVHLEMRIEENGNIVPMEVNPLRFMGFCVADVEYYFYGINPYEYFFEQKHPDWQTILSSRKNKIYGMMGIDMPKKYKKGTVNFDYDKFINHFTKPLNYVKMDYNRFPMAIFMFAEVDKNNFKELEYVLHSDIEEFIY